MKRGAGRGVMQRLGRPGPGALRAALAVLGCAGAVACSGDQRPAPPGLERRDVAERAGPNASEAPRAGGQPGATGDAPRITGSGEPMPAGYVATVTLAGRSVTLAYTQIGAIVSRAGAASLLLTAEPGHGGRVRDPRLSIAWDVPTAEVSDLAGLAGRRFTFERVPLGRAVMRVAGKEYMATALELRVDEASADEIRGGFRGTFGEFHPRRSVKPMGELPAEGTFRAYPGPWIELTEQR